MKFNVGWLRSNNIIKAALLIFWGAVSVLAIFALTRYSGHGYVYVLFTIIANLLLYFGFRKNAIFFDTFIGIIFWLGFWFKLTIRVSFSSGLFNEAVGNFNGSGAAFDKALLVSSCGLFGFLLASFVREKLSCNYPPKIEGIAQRGLFDFYRNHRQFVLSGFVALFVVVALTNAYLGIYQRGCITRTTLPFGLNGVYKWLLLFGLASFSALILRFEFEINGKTSILVMFLSLLESFISNVSLLSRGMVLNSSALIYGVFASLRLHSIKSNARFFVTTLLIFVTLFVSSYFVVNYLRLSFFSDRTLSEISINKKTAMLGIIIPSFVIDRWVGMEGVMAISSYPNLGWDLWKTALKESYNEKELSFYDNIMKTQYLNIDKTKHHFISLPGIIAFFFYPGSYLFLFVSMFALGAVAAAIEACVFKLGGQNVILCALIAQVVAYRYSCFGYVPKQSYLLFGTIFLNLIMIYLADKALLRLYRNNPSG
jgi:hypothetical protein